MSEVTPIPDHEKFTRASIAEDFQAVVRGDMTMEAFNLTYGNAARVYESEMTHTGYGCLISADHLID